MLFNSIEFCLFFAVIFILYFSTVHFIKKNIVSQILLLISSLFFYACWNPAYLSLIITSVIITFFSGILMETHEKHKKLILIISLVSNLAILFFFKYYNFAASTIDWIAEHTGRKFGIPYLNVLLPVGISFYTFQALGYSIDVYRGTVKAERNIITYGLFVTFFPQLVAGPIERTDNLLPQFKVDHEFDYDRVVSGLKQAAWGFFQKIVVADNIAVYVTNIYNKTAEATGSALALATLLFAVQILCDFAGYSDIAIGVSRVLGFNLKRNFNRPYFSKSISEFWRRWHVSLATWFRDYVYIPMGGSRCSVWRRYFNLFFTFFLSGVWHGASWTYITWGAIQGIYQVIELSTFKFRAKLMLKWGLAVENKSVKSGIQVKRGWQIVQIFWTFFLFLISLVCVRANSMADIGHIYKKFMAIPSEIAFAASQVSVIGIKDAIRDLFNLVISFSGFGYKDLVFAFALSAVIFAKEVLTRNVDGVTLVNRWPLVCRWLLYWAALMCFIFLAANGKAEFFYFQF